MKLLTIAITLSISAASLSSMASNVVFKPTNQTVETQACYVAATEGLRASRALINKNDIDFDLFSLTVSCNGDSLRTFAKQYQPQTSKKVEVENEPSITLVAKNTESMVCIDALVMGEQQARKKHNTGEDGIICNNKNIETFVRQYQNENFLVRNSAQ
jgi:hypothetical protein